MQQLQWRGRAIFAIPALAGLVTGLWGVSSPSYWRDESVSVLVSQGSFTGIWEDITGNYDATHGLYYVFMHFVTYFGTSELIMRLPSVLAAALAAGGIAVIGRKLFSPLAGVAAGLVYATFPVVSRYAQEARSYAIVSALAVLATYLLIRALEDDHPNRRWYIAYGLSMVLVGWLHMYSLFLIGAHVLTALIVALRRKHQLKSQHLFAFGVTTLGVVVAVTPLVLVARGYDGGVNRPPKPKLAAVQAFGVEVAGSELALAIVAVLALVGILAAWWQRDPERPVELVTVALPWLVVPFGAAFGISQLHSVYRPRYILYCIGGLALLAGVGIAGLARLLAAKRRTARWSIAALVVVALAATTLPAHAAIREPTGRPDNLRGLANALRAEAHGGDAVLYVPTYRAVFVSVYKEAFERLDTASLQDKQGQDLPTPRFADQIAKESRIWVVKSPPPHNRYRSPVTLANLKLLHNGGTHKFIRKWKFGSVTLILYEHVP